MIDTHAHLYAKEFTEDIDEVISRAKLSGVSNILLPNIDVNSIQGITHLVDAYPNYFYRMMGLHPCSVKENYEEELAIIKQELDTQKCIAVGEIGIDLYWDKTTQQIQENAFLEQCQWAVDADLPIVIHSRESTSLLLDLLDVHFKTGIQGVFHCFGGTEEEAERIVDRDMYMGIGGVVTFKNTALRDILKNVPINRLILETDSPYLAPVPYRGKRNESSYLTYVANQLSTVYNVPISEIDTITTSNALNLFKL